MVKKLIQWRFETKLLELVDFVLTAVWCLCAEPADRGHCMHCMYCRNILQRDWCWHSLLLHVLEILLLRLLPLNLKCYQICALSGEDMKPYQAVI
jgi:hypothetical protein